MVRSDGLFSWRASASESANKVFTHLREVSQMEKGSFSQENQFPLQF